VTRCIKCHRPLMRETATGMGPVCAKNAAPAPVHERDLFGYDIDRALDAAHYLLRIQLLAAVVQAQWDVKHSFRAARVRLGVWSA
jgi:hypothetical protein